jgi:PPOX class probable F420-dependent enzyme
MDANVRALFGEGRNFPTLATIMADGSPHAISIWSGVEDDRIVFFTGRDSLKARNIARDPRVALSVVDLENPYRTARVRGRVIETRDGDAAMEVVDRISRRYVGAEFEMRDMTLYVVELDRESFMELPFEHS